MTPSTTVYDTLKLNIINTLEKLHINLLQKRTNAGRPLAIKFIDILTLGVFRAEQGIETKKDLFTLFTLPCSYKTLVVNLNRFAIAILHLCMKLAEANRVLSHPIKYTDSTDVPVCLTKNATHHQTMKDYAAWGKTGKGWFFGLKWHVTTDAYLQILSFSFTSGNQGDRSQFMVLNKMLAGIFVADAGYVSKKLAHEFYRENIRILITKPLRKMKKLATPAQNDLYTSRSRIESVMRHLKMFEGFVSSLCRSIDGYFAHYFYALAAFMLKGVEQNKLLLN